MPFVSPYHRHTRVSGNDRPSGNTAEATHSASQAEQAGVLKVTTAEGDVVTISFAGLQRSQTDSYSAATPQGKVSGYAGSASSTLAIGVKVEGSLNSQEMADIGDLMDHLGAAVQDAKAGNTDQMMADLAGTTSLHSLQGFQFDYRESVSAVYGQAYSKSQAG